MKTINAYGIVVTVPSQNRWGKSKRKSRAWDIGVFDTGFYYGVESDEGPVIIGNWTTVGGSARTGEYGYYVDSEGFIFMGQSNDWCAAACNSLNHSTPMGFGIALTGGRLYNALIRNAPATQISD